MFPRKLDDGTVGVGASRFDLEKYITHRVLNLGLCGMWCVIYNALAGPIVAARIVSNGKGDQLEPIIHKHIECEEGIQVTI